MEPKEEITDYNYTVSEKELLIYLVEHQYYR